jgi:steroid delta-isomerase-like uncharacterized protein
MLASWITYLRKVVYKSLEGGSVHPKDVARRFVDEYQSKGDEAVLDELVGDDFVDHSPTPGLPEGKEGVRALFRMLHGSLPDLRAEVYDQICEGSTVATRKAFLGTHQGDLFGVPPTNKSIHIDVIDFVRVQDDHIAEHWNLVDTAGLMEQLQS